MPQQTRKPRSDKPSSPKRRKREESSILWHFESMDRINLAMQGTNDLEQVMKDVLDTLLSVFECDRAFLVYPCDPESATWQVPMERVRPEYPGALPVGIEMPLTAAGAEVFRSLRATKGPVQFGPGLEHEVDPDTRQKFNIQSYIAMALYPKIGKPWSFGLHQCSHARTWTAEEERLLQEIGGRLSDTLTSLLAYRNLQRSEQQVKQLIEASPVAMIVSSGIEERVEWMNGQFTELFGYTIEDVPDVEHWWPLAYPDDAYRTKLQAQWTADVEQAIREKGQTRPIEAIVRCKDGSRRFIEFRFSSIGEKHLVTFVDLTERRNAEEKLRTSEHNYREVFENVSDALFLLEVTEDGHFRNMEVNRAFEISTGFSRDQLLGKIIEEVVPQETADAVNAKYRHCLEAGTVIEEEVKLQLPTGLQTYHSSLIPVRDGNGRIYRIIGITRDITESRRMQEALRVSEEELRSLINTMTDIIFVGNAEGRFLKIMDTNPPLLYKPSQELLGRTLHEVFPKDMADLFLNHLQRALSTRQSVNFEYSLPIGGQEMWFYATVSPMTDDKTLMVARDITEQKRVAEALAAREREYRTLAEHSPDNIARYDVNCRTTYVNPTLEKTLGVPASEMIGTLPAEAGFIVEAEEFHAKIVNVLQTGINDEMDLVLPDMGDGVRYHNIRFVAERGADGAITGVQAIGRDMTERKQAEMALSRERELLRTLVDNLPEEIYVKDRERRFLFVNELLVRALGARSMDDVIGKRDEDFWPPYLAKQFADEENELMRTGKPLLNDEHTPPHKSGPKRWLLRTKLPLRDGAGNIIGLAGLGSDITERKQAEQAVRESEERLRQIASSLREVVWLRDAKTRQVLYVNPAFQELTGRTCESFYENRDAIIDAIHPDDRTWVTQALDQRSQSVPFNKEHRIIHLDGSVRWVSSRSFAVLNEAGEVYRWASSMEDITERRLAENALRDSEEKYRLLHENAGVGIGYYKPNGEIISYNQLAASYMKGKPEDFEGKSIYEVFPSAEADVYMERIRKSLESESTIEYKDHLVLPSGQTWFLSIFTRICDAQQKPIGVQIISQDITEQKQAEEALRASENRFRVLSETAFVGIYIILDGRISYVNSTHAKIFGYTPEELIGADPRLLVHPDDQAMVMEDIRRRIEGEIETIHYEFRGRCKDGSTKNIEVLGGRIDFGGKTAVIGNLMDITERKQAEAALRDSERRLIEAQRIAHVGYWERNVEAGYIILSDEACRIFGLSPQDVPFSLEQWHQRWLELIHPEDRSRTSKVAADALAGASAYNVEYRIIRPGGEVRFIHSEASVSRDESGRPLSMLGMMQDITDRKQAEDELRQNRESTLQFSARLTALLEVTNELSKAESSATLCRQAVQWGRSRLGFDRISIWFIEEHLGIMRGSFGTDEHGELRDEQNSQVEFRHEGLAWLLFSHRDQVALIEHRPLFDHLAHEVGMGDNAMAALWDGGKVIGVISVDNLLTGRPISEHALEVLRLYASTLGHLITRKRAEEDIRRLNQELEQRVAARTAQLAEANEELESFAYSVSHDLRAPLRHVDGFIDLLQKRIQAGLDEKSQHYMEMITDSARMMGVLIDDLLSFSRMSRAEMVRLPVDLNELVQDVIQQFILETQERKVEWKIGPLPQTTGDRAMLRIALVNLISNALKFTRDRETARIEIECVQAYGPEIILFVRDNGVGFDRNYADNLFGVFQRLHHTDEFEGTGIGLATVRRIVNRHGGRIWAEAQVDRGATFYFSIPSSAQEKP